MASLANEVTVNTPVKTPNTQLLVSYMRKAEVLVSRSSICKSCQQQSIYRSFKKSLNEHKKIKEKRLKKEMQDQAITTD